MSIDTTEINRRLARFDGEQQVWLFGYGSLIYKADFDYLERRPATIQNYARRFWQGSHDHRGTPEAPGRVVTLIAEPGAVCTGMAYHITPAVFAHLDHREKNGYLRQQVRLTFTDGLTAEALVYIAEEDNAAWLGPKNEDEIARQIAAASGPSGENKDYLLRLAQALRSLGAEDAHIFSIEAHLASSPSRITFAETTLGTGEHQT